MPSADEGWIVLSSRRCPFAARRKNLLLKGSIQAADAATGNALRTTRSTLSKLPKQSRLKLGTLNHLEA